MKRKASETPSKKTKRCSPSSRATLMHMSRKSQLKRKSNAKIKRDGDVRKRKKYEIDMDIPFNNEQDEEMSEVVATIDSKCLDELAKLFEEGDNHGVGERIKEIWATDKPSVQQDF
uniref:Uncharacterized protein n=1 Tax=Amphimedon queenslandica TaxID=400682 RepID=A0A1X7VHD9_AMPQE